MSSPPHDRLYNLLPAVYRLRDADQAQTLRAFLALIENEMQQVEADITRLHENWFVETTDDWLLPYLGDLLGTRWLHDTFGQRANVASLRAYVANTLAYRRRKGTAAVLEQLALDVTGWRARAVEFFQLLGTTQYLNHVRMGNVRTPDLRNVNQLELLDGPFQDAAHTVDVRRIASGRGRYNIPNIGLFLWRLQSYLVEEVAAFPVSNPADGRYTFDPLGRDIPLFNRPQTETEISNLAGEVNVPDRLRRLPLYVELEQLRQKLVDGQQPSPVYFSEQPVFQIRSGDEVSSKPYDEVLICDLSDWRDPPTSRHYTRDDGAGVARPIRVAVDPVLGRIAFPTGAEPASEIEVLVSYSYGFSADVGGGPYDRRHRGRSEAAQPQGVDTVAEPGAYDQLVRVPTDQPTIGGALAAWNPTANPRLVVQIEDNRTYREDLTIAMAGSELVIQAGNEDRPVLLGDITVTGGTEEQRLALNGLLVAGSLEVGDALGQLDVVHTTLAPGLALDAADRLVASEEPKLVIADTNTQMRLTLERTISGALRVSSDMVSLTIRDSIVDSGPSRHTPALVSGSLSSFPVLSSGTPSVNVSIGDEGPQAVILSQSPVSLIQARDLLQQGIRDAHSSPAFANTRVIARHNRLVILPGVAESLTVGTVDADVTAIELRLDRTEPASNARLVTALLGSRLPASFPLAAEAPGITVSMGRNGPLEIWLTPDAANDYNFAALRDDLHAAIRGADSADAFAQAMVASVENQLVILPGTEGIVPVMGSPSTDSSTLAELALETYRPAIASGDRNQHPGPATTLERATVLGRVYVRELALASETIFTAPVVAQRLQTGCARFSYVPQGSRTPQRYRCQPDLALRGTNDPALEEHIRARLTPAFTSLTHSHPGYAQLSLTCADEVRRGAEDGSEMGVFSYLKQPQREANLLASLDEYLRFGLEAGLLYVT